MVRAALLLLVVVAAVYGRALVFGFVYDDRLLIELNRALADFSTLPAALLGDLFVHAETVRPSPYWRPVVSASYYLDYWLGGGQPWVFHLNNLVVLWAAGMGVWRLLEPRWGGLQALAWAALFTVHPAQVEAVSNVAARTDLYCAAFGVWGLVYASRRPWVSCVLLLAACGSKEIGVVFPLAYWAWWGPGRYAWRLPAVGVLGFVGVRTVLVSQWGVEAGAVGWEGVLHAAGRALALSGQLLWPAPVSHGALVGAPGLGASVAGWMVCALGGWQGWRWLRQAPGLATGTVLILGPTLIAMLAAPEHPRVSQGFLVVPVLGLVLGFQVWLQERRSILRPLGVVVLALGATSATRVGVWESDSSLFEASFARDSGDPNVRLNLARTVVSEAPERSLDLLEGVRPQAERQQREAAAVRARALLTLDRTDEAVVWLKQAVGTDVESAWAVGTLCVLLAGTPAVAAQDHCTAAVKLLPGDPDVANAMGVVYGRGEDHAKAAYWFGLAVEMAPERDVFRGNLQAARSAMQSQEGVIDRSPE